MPREAGRRAMDAVGALVLLGLPWLLYPQVLGLWWTEDDFFQLRYALAHAPWEYAFDPGVWRLLPNRVLSPLLFASYDLDLALFGLSPRAFYAHQLVSLGLSAAALYLVLRLWLPARWSLLGGVLLLLGPPMAALAPLLMVRHYPEALGLALLSAWAWVLANRWKGSGSILLALLSASLYLMASAAKEIALPLPLVLAALPGRPWRRRALLLLPHAGVATLYAVYRTWMLGTPIGGYGLVVLSGRWPAVLAHLPGQVARELAGGSGWGRVALAAMTAVALLGASRSRSTSLLLLAGLCFAWLPIVPVALVVGPRLTAASWLVLSVAFVLAAAHLSGATGRKAPIVVGLVFVCGILFAGNRASWTERLAAAERKSAENRGYLELGSGDFLRHPASSPAAMEELGRFARTVLGRPARGDWFYDDLFLCRPGGSGPLRSLRTLWSYDEGTGRLADVTSQLRSLRRRQCARIRRGAPLEVDLGVRDGRILQWAFGPYPDSRYAFVLQDGRIRYDVPREGGFRLGAGRKYVLRVRYASPAGWVTYSPRLSFDLEPGQSLRWRRGDPPESQPPPPW